MVASAEAVEPVPAPVLAVAVRAELVAAKRETSALGVTALALAARIDAGVDTGSAIASLSREMRAALLAATAGAAREASGLDVLQDELAARRRA